MQRGLVFNIQKFSMQDGPGIRTTVFLKGCPLCCAWCHNPEGLRRAAELVWYDVRCIGTRDCLRVCQEDALSLTDEGIRIDRTRCTACGRCAKACPAAALELIGRDWTVDDLLAEILKDAVFYETSGGGVTFSGGEPMLHADFLVELLPRCKAAGLHVALDTCGVVPWSEYERVLPFVDLLLLDLKIMDPEQHRAATGVSNEPIVANARRFSECGLPMWIRTPIIPGFTDTPQNLGAIAAFIHDMLPAVDRWYFLAYTNLGRPKYKRLGLGYPLERTALLTAAQMEDALHSVIDLVPYARWSGATSS